MNGTLNKVMLIGYTGDDVKMHYFENGNCIGRFPLATNESYTTKSGERVNNVDWHNVVVNNKLAEVFEKYVKKGDRIYIEGKIRTRKWTDDGGIERYSTEVVVREFTFLTPKEAGSSGVVQPGTSKPESADNRSSQESDINETGYHSGSPSPTDDVPF